MLYCFKKISLHKYQIRALGHSCTNCMVIAFPKYKKKMSFTGQQMVNTPLKTKQNKIPCIKCENLAICIDLNQSENLYCIQCILKKQKQPYITDLMGWKGGREWWTK